MLLSWPKEWRFDCIPTIIWHKIWLSLKGESMYTQMYEFGLLAVNRPEFISRLATQCSKIGVNTAPFRILATVLVCVLPRIISALCNMMGKTYVLNRNPACTSNQILTDIPIIIY